MGDASRRKTILDYIKHLPVRVFPVGRLDYDVTGLILLTNDGALAERLLHPRYGVPRVYWAVVSGKPRRAMLTKLKQGVAIAGKLVHVEQVSVLGPSKRAMRLFGPPPKGTALIQVMVSRGEKHMVKNILAAVGLPVVQLCRVAFGEYRLGSLKPGEVREV